MARINSRSRHAGNYKASDTAQDALNWLPRAATFLFNSL